jgi:hypothetical protein
MADKPPVPTTAELAEAGVEMSEPVAVTAKEPPRAKFKERKLKGEPATDRKVVLEGGFALRERVDRIETLADGVVTAAPSVAPTTIIVGISHALLDEADKVARNAAGAAKISTCYTVTFDAEALGRIGSTEALREIMLIEREKAAAQARLQFEGMALAEEFGI